MKHLTIISIEDREFLLPEGADGGALLKQFAALLPVSKEGYGSSTRRSVDRGEVPTVTMALVREDTVKFIGDSEAAS